MLLLQLVMISRVLKSKCKTIQNENFQEVFEISLCGHTFIKNVNTK